MNKFVQVQNGSNSIYFKPISATFIPRDFKHEPMRVLPLYHVTLDTTNESITFVPRDVRCWGTIDDTLQLDSGPFCSSRILYAVGDLGFNYNNKRVCKFFNKSYLRIPLDDYDCRICLVSQ